MWTSKSHCTPHIKLRSDGWGIYSENDFNVSDSKFDIQSPLNNIMVDEGKLTHPGYIRSPFYFPVPGWFGVSKNR